MDPFAKPTDTTGSSSLLAKSAIVIRFLGIAVMFVGLVWAFQVVIKAWDLLEDPDEILPFAERIEKHSGVNDYANTLSEALVGSLEMSQQTMALMNAQGAQVPQQDKVEKQKGLSKLNVSYFAAWLIVVVLLGLIGRLSLWAMGQGAKVALYSTDYDRQLKGILRELVYESKMQRSVGRSEA